LHAIFVPTGNPGPDFDGEARPGDNLFSNSTMVLNPDTGHLKYWFQYTPHDNWDYDGVNEVILADIAGKKVWLHGDRNGHLYSIDRTNGKCVWVVEIAEINWASGFDSNCRPIVNPAMDPEHNGRDVVTVGIHPSLDGGKEWHPMSYSPRSNLIFVPTYNFGMDLQPLDQQWERGQWYLGAQVIRITDGNGSLRAHDATTGELVWENVSQYPGTSATMSTAGGLVFWGDPTGMFRAANDETGEELWAFQTGTGIHGSPTTWSINGTQYVGAVVGAGGGGLWPLHYGEWLKNNTKGGALFVFSLD
jgi:alcohol dehydrogenase (cytochrome c)